MDNPFEHVLNSNGFRYDIEDNLWYDEHPSRAKYILRAGINRQGISERVELYKSGYDNKIGCYNSPAELQQAIDSLRQHNGL